MFKLAISEKLCIVYHKHTSRLRAPRTLVRELEGVLEEVVHLGAAVFLVIWLSVLSVV